MVERRPTPAAAPARRRGQRPAALCAAPAPARHAIELAHEGVPLNVIQRQLDHANLGTSSIDDRVVAVTTSRQLRQPEDHPRMITAYIDG